jgi:hypothetical protein
MRAPSQPPGARRPRTPLSTFGRVPRAPLAGHLPRPECHTGRVNTVVTIRRRDGKLYPAPIGPGELNRARALAHALVCRDGMSVRGAREAMLAYGLRRSNGWVWHTLHHYACGHPRCPCVPIGPAGG